MLTIWTNKIKHSTVGSSFSVTFSVAPNELEYLNKLYDCFSSMNWSSFPITTDRKTENSSEIPNNCEHITEDGVTCAKYPACDDCLDNPLNKVKGSERLLKGKDEPQKKEVEWVYNKRERLWYPYSNGELLFKDEPMKTTDYCDICKRDMCEDCIADATNPYCVPSHYEINYEPKDEPQTETQIKTQISNLPFEKDECAKEYEELGLKELKELIKADRNDEFFREPTAEERKAVADYIDSISVPTGVNVFDLMDESQTYVINPQEPTNDEKCFECDDFFTCSGQCDKIEDEPQTERSE